MSAAAFADNAWLFGTDAVGEVTQAAAVDVMPPRKWGDLSDTSFQNPPIGYGKDLDSIVEVPMRFAGTIVIYNDSAIPADGIEFSFDGVNVHGVVFAGEKLVYRERHEAGIAIRTLGVGGACSVRIEAW